jgi:spoIIIJ-associated protein
MTESTDIEEEQEAQAMGDEIDESVDSDNPQAERPQAEAAEGDEEPQHKGRKKRPAAPPDEQSEQALAFVEEVLQCMQMDCAAQLRRNKDPDSRDIRIEISGRDSARVIGKRGQVLGALQFLANRALNRPGEERRYVTVDAEGYRSRRDNSLAAMAKRLGKQAMNDGKIITFEPMPPRDRRLVHLALAKFDGVITKSEGEGEDRRVQIIPVRRS